MNEQAVNPSDIREQAPGADIVLHADRLSRSFEGRLVVDELDLQVARGSIFGLIGPNGSGKSTTVRMLLGLLTPDAGSSTVLGHDSLFLPPEIRQQIGYMSEQPFPQADLPVPYLLRFLAKFFDDWDWEHCADLLRRFPVPQQTPLEKLSAGERRKAELILLLAPRPEVLVLDDPVAGLDATARRDFLYAALAAARDEGRTVLFTSHVLHDVERIVDTVAILVAGRLRVLGELDELKARCRRVIVHRPPEGLALEVPGVLQQRREGRDAVLVTSAYEPDLERRLGALGLEIRIEGLNLEEIYCAHVDAATEADASMHATTDGAP